MDYTVGIVFMVIIFLRVFTDATPEDKRLKCVKNGIEHNMAVDDVERLCGKKK